MNAGWQPIETAPKDEHPDGRGPPVLVYIPTGEIEHSVAVAVYWGGWSTVEDNLDIEPTHWMPLPEPPK